MPPAAVYYEIRRLVKEHLDPQVGGSTLERITLLVMGIIGARSASPAQLPKRCG